MSRADWTWTNAKGRPNAWGWTAIILYFAVMSVWLVCAKWIVKSYGTIGAITTLAAIFGVAAVMDFRRWSARQEQELPPDLEAPRLSAPAQSALEMPPVRRSLPRR